MARCLLLAGLTLRSASRADDSLAPLQPLTYHADLLRVARWPCAFVGDLVVPASGEGAHPFGGLMPLHVPVDLRIVNSAAHFDELLLPQFMELCAQVATKNSTLDCATAVLQSVHHAAGRVCSGKAAEEPTTLSDAENREGMLRRHALRSQPPLHNPSHARSRGEARAITERDAAAQQPKLLNRLNKMHVNVTFAGADSRSPKVLPCNWAEDVAVLAGNVPLTVPMHLSIDGRGGAPVKSFAQAFSFLRDNLRATCAQVVTMHAQSQSISDSEAVHAGHADSSGSYNVDACVSEIEDSLLAAALKACPSQEPLQRSLESSDAANANEDDKQTSPVFSGRSSRPDGRRSDRSNAVLHVRALAGDELEHYWHFFVGELLPSVSAALQTLHQLPPDVWTTTNDGNNSRESSRRSSTGPSDNRTRSTNGINHGRSTNAMRPVLTVVVHNPLRPWGASPLHGVYSELTAATNGALVFKPSPYDCVNAEAINDIDDGDGSSTGTGTGTGTESHDDTFGQALRHQKLDESSLEVSLGAQQCRGVAVVRLPRWDYEAQGEDLKKLGEAADFLSRILLMHSKETNTTKASAIHGSGVTQLRRIVQNSIEEWSPTVVNNVPNRGSSNGRKRSNSLGDSNANNKPALTMVVQQRSHDAALGAFYSNYFCKLIATGDLPYLSKEGCGRYGSQTRHVAGLPTLALQLNATYADLSVVLTAPDGGTSLADQASPYFGADLLLLGHGGGMAHALWMHAQRVERRRNTRPAIVLEITSAAKHAESNGAARGLITLAQARNAMLRPANEGCEAHGQPPLLTVRRLVCTDTSAHAIDLLSGSSDGGTNGSRSANGNINDGSSQSNGEFSGDVSDMSTPCGALLQEEVNKALLRLRARRDIS